MRYQPLVKDLPPGTFAFTPQLICADPQISGASRTRRQFAGGHPAPKACGTFNCGCCRTDFGHAGIVPLLRKKYRKKYREVREAVGCRMY
jgi:hypothetical protein